MDLGKELGKEFKALKNAKDKCHSKIEKLTGLIKDKVEFDFEIFYQHSDGFVSIKAADTLLSVFPVVLLILDQDAVLPFGLKSLFLWEKCLI